MDGADADEGEADSEVGSVELEVLLGGLCTSFVSHGEPLGHDLQVVALRKGEQEEEEDDEPGEGMRLVEGWTVLLELVIERREKLGRGVSAIIGDSHLAD